MHLETGSFNYSGAAANRNAENVLLLWNVTPLAKDYTNEWKELWKESEVLKAHIDQQTKAMTSSCEPTGIPPRKSSITTKDQYIRRHEDGSRRQWRVKFARLGKVIAKSFSDTVYGGKEQALIAARAFRDQWFANFDETAQKIWRREAARPKKIPSMTGTARYVKENDEPYWLAYWKLPDGSRKSKTFFVKQYGEKGARQKAEEARLAGMAAVAEALKKLTNCS